MLRWVSAFVWRQCLEGRALHSCVGRGVSVVLIDRMFMMQAPLTLLLRTLSKEEALSVLVGTVAHESCNGPVSSWYPLAAKVSC